MKELESWDPKYEQFICLMNYFNNMRNEYIDRSIQGTSPLLDNNNIEICTKDYE